MLDARVMANLTGAVWWTRFDVIHGAVGPVKERCAVISWMSSIQTDVGGGLPAPMRSVPNDPVGFQSPRHDQRLYASLTLRTARSLTLGEIDDSVCTLHDSIQ
jgi:hypothetical protein